MEVLNSHLKEKERIKVIGRPPQYTASMHHTTSRRTKGDKCMDSFINFQNE